ncbi:MAG: glutamyl-tRNA reductase [Gemmatimonadaceae bacterium]|jgi:glutamyl-tRNA reductase|nr:glutamyl-tRNA reductase [Gemmatimonadaceae bacterium]
MLICLAVDYRKADVATRERFHLAEQRMGEMYHRLMGGGVSELALVSTCNRTELYAWTEASGQDALERAVEHLASVWMPDPIERASLLTTLTLRIGDEVGRHLMRLAGGLESQILGDGQILGQVRSAYRTACEMDTVGPMLHRLFEIALRTGRRIQHETALSTGRNSVGAEAASVALRRFGSLEHARCVVVGCGKTGTRAARQLHKLGATDIVLINRTPQRAEELARSLKGRVAPIETLHAEAAMADVVIVATGAATYTVDATTLATARENVGTADAPLLLMDLALPRNVDPRSSAVTGITLVDLDSLHPPIVAAETARRSAVPSAERIVEAEMRWLRHWLATGAARLAIRSLHDALVDLCRREVAFVAGDGVAERTAQRIAAKLLARPMHVMSDAIARGENVDDLAEHLDQLFAAPPRRGVTAEHAVLPPAPATAPLVTVGAPVA